VSFASTSGTNIVNSGDGGGGDDCKGTFAFRAVVVAAVATFGWKVITSSLETFLAAELPETMTWTSGSSNGLIS
jgi:hypothetical protein